MLTTCKTYSARNCMQTLSLVVQPDIALGQVDRQFSGFRPGFRGQQLAPIPAQLQKNNLIKVWNWSQERSICCGVERCTSEWMKQTETKNTNIALKRSENKTVENLWQAAQECSCFDWLCMVKGSNHSIAQATASHCEGCSHGGHCHAGCRITCCRPPAHRIHGEPHPCSCGIRVNVNASEADRMSACIKNQFGQLVQGWLGGSNVQYALKRTEKKT